MNFTRWIPMVLACFLIAAGPVGAEEPLDALKAPMEKVLTILKNNHAQPGGDKEKQKQELFAATQEIFDYIETSKRALGRQWRSFTPEERKQFVDAFSRLLQNTYVRKVQGGFQDEEVVFLEQQKLSETKALVKTQIVSKGNQVAVDYRMIFKNNKWRVYDVIAEGISLVKNYRTQFSDILSKETPAQLIERLNQKLTEIKDT